MALAPFIPLIASGISAVGDLIAGKSANDSNRELAELSYQRQREMFDYSNAYNTPAAQMKRFQEAGLNPNLIYGQSANTAVQAPKYDPPRIEKTSPKIENVANDLLVGLAMKRQQAEIKNIEAQTALTEEKKRTEAILQRVRTVTGDRLDYDLNVAKTLQDYNNQIVVSNSEKAQQEVAKIQQEIANMSHQEALLMLQKFTDTEKMTGAKLDNELKRADILYKNNENAFRSLGITSSDDVRIRLFVKMLQQFNINPLKP